MKEDKILYELQGYLSYCIDSNSQNKKFPLSCNKKNRTVEFFYVLHPSMFASIQKTSLFVDLL